jgi:type I restriction enzyme M protein
MADEQSQLRSQPSVVPHEYSWPNLRAKHVNELEMHYRHVLEELGKRPGMLSIISRKAQNKIQDPAKLCRLIVDLIDREQWSSLLTDVKDESLEDSASPPEPGVLALEIAEDLEAALQQFAAIAEDLKV